MRILNIPASTSCSKSTTRVSVVGWPVHCPSCRLWYEECLMYVLLRVSTVPILGDHLQMRGSSSSKEHLEAEEILES